MNHTKNGTIKLAVLGDYNETVTAHRAIPIALRLAANHLQLDFSHRPDQAIEVSVENCIEYTWIETSNIDLHTIDNYHGIWCVPASPYKNPNKVISAIQYARENHIPWLGTCGGYQHAVLEFARNVLGLQNAQTSEEHPLTTTPLITAMACKLYDEADDINLTLGSQLAKIVGSTTIRETYFCGFGVNKDYQNNFATSELQFCGFDNESQPKAFELIRHDFFIGTAFQPERSALANQSHPLIESFVQHARHYQQQTNQ